MKRTRTAGALSAALIALSSYSLRADVRADQKSHVEFAGMLGRKTSRAQGSGLRAG